MEPVARVQQENSATCLAACVTMVLRRFGIEAEPQLTIHQSLLDPALKIPSEPLAAALLKRKGLNVTHSHDFTIDTLRDACQNGLGLCRPGSGSR